MAIALTREDSSAFRLPFADAPSTGDVGGGGVARDPRDLLEPAPAGIPTSTSTPKEAADRLRELLGGGSRTPGTVDPAPLPSSDPRPVAAPPVQVLVRAVTTPAPDPEPAPAPDPLPAELQPAAAVDPRPAPRPPVRDLLEEPTRTAPVSVQQGTAADLVGELAAPDPAPATSPTPAASSSSAPTSGPALLVALLAALLLLGFLAIKVS